ncbi:helix-turn-helix domain-containing protein [Nocardia bovistercoris]|uniref:Helix-turn-helix domain-containing protein n=1 Tax=Nocardia bovistercoris TaxID=2785916 RepID=A0A931IH62_9NOCA|nr:helix-turn-helix domain-containing protein [Nocardia bovistercoris]MBH0781349.1 helix-turn-helix domain-containing protein [Nocardia bovistercoris]
MTIEDIHALPAMLGIEVAGRALGLSRQHAYTLRMNGEFPVQVRRIGSRYKVSKADVMRYLGIDPSAHGVTTPPAATDNDGGISPVVTIRSGRVVHPVTGKVIEPDKGYKVDGRAMLGADIIAVLHRWGVVA